MVQVYVISTSSGVSCSHINFAFFQVLSEGCLMMIEPICSVSFVATVILSGTGECRVRAAIIIPGLSNSDQLVSGTHACLAISSSHVKPHTSSELFGSIIVTIPRSVFCVYSSCSSSAVV